MIRTVLKLSLLGMLTGAIAGLPGSLSAQDDQRPAADKSAAHDQKARKSGVLPFHGKLKAVDPAAKTISVGELVLQVTSETKITKAGKPATLEEGVVGEPAGGAYKKADDGKLCVTTLHLGPRPDKPENRKERADQ